MPFFPLGLTTGGPYQPLNGNLSQISEITPSTNGIMQYKAGAWDSRTLTQVWQDFMADPGVGAYAYTALPFTITDDKRLLGRDSALPPFTASEISIGGGLDLSSGVLTATGSAAGDPVTDFTMATNRILGRTTAGTGAVEELTVGSSLSLSAGSINAIQDIQTSASPSFSTVTSTVATGTAPFTVASTTVVANLNASLLLGSTWAAPGAIGSTTPAAGRFTALFANSFAAAASGKNIEIGHDGTQSVVQSYDRTGLTYNPLWLEAGGSGGYVRFGFDGAEKGRVDVAGFQGAIGATTPSTVACTTLKATSLPTSSAGLAAGDIWNNGGVLNIV